MTHMMTHMTVTWICFVVTLISSIMLIGYLIYSSIKRVRRWEDFEDLKEAVKADNEIEVQRIKALYLEDVEFCEYADQLE